MFIAADLHRGQRQFERRSGQGFALVLDRAAPLNAAGSHTGCGQGLIVRQIGLLACIAEALLQGLAETGFTARGGQMANPWPLALGDRAELSIGFEPGELAAGVGLTGIKARQQLILSHR